MRKIDEIIIHCTGTIPSNSTTVEAVRKYHKEHNGWKDIGYHYLIYLDGSISKAVPSTTRVLTAPTTLKAPSGSAMLEVSQPTKRQRTRAQWHR